MNLLLDTHIAIWALNDDPLLSPKARELILDPDNTIYYSAVSVWEEWDRGRFLVPRSSYHIGAFCQGQSAPSGSHQRLQKLGQGTVPCPIFKSWDKEPSRNH
jgi:hypothetical protein